jgi:hypothetical protein
VVSRAPGSVERRSFQEQTRISSGGAKFTSTECLGAFLFCETLGRERRSGDVVGCYVSGHGRGKLDVLEFAFIQFPRGLCPRRPELYQIRPQLRVTFSFSQSDAFAGTLQAFLRFSAHGNLMRRPNHSK